MSNIPLHKLHEYSEIGFEVRHHLRGVDNKGLESHHYFKKGDKKSLKEFYAHRDDNYFFILAEHGDGASMKVDFNLVKFVDRDIYFVAPGQVHHDAKGQELDYWYISIAPSLIPKEYLEVFENAIPLQKPQNMNETEFQQCQSILRLLEEQFISDKDAAFYRQMTQGLLQTFLCLVARQYVKNDLAVDIFRPQQITRDFKRLLKDNVRLHKSPSHYASVLNISESYLNESVKKTTGFTAGYWIRYYVVLEAQRLLFYTEANVKEIAYALGYNDHTYFSKLFRQTTGTTPLAFRITYMK